MNYEKPDMTALASAFAAIQATGKQGSHYESVMPPVLTSPAYEADE